MADLSAIADGMVAWIGAKKYHSASAQATQKKPPVYHDRKDCPAGLAIAVRDLRQGKGGRADLCEDCERLARPAAR